MIQSELINPNEVLSDENLKSYHINQRSEGIDLEGISGALMATQNIQMQTFVKEPFYCLNDQGGERMNVSEDVVGTLRASMGGNAPIVMGNPPLLFDNHGKDARYNGPLKVAPTVAATYGTGGNNIPLVKQDSYCIASNTINRADQHGGNGKGVQKDISYTLTTADIHAVYNPIPYQKVVGTLAHRDYKGVNSIYVRQDKCVVDAQVFGQTSYGGYGEEVSTLCASGGSNGGGSENLALTRNLVRRLTPLECERLQGFPDGWTQIEKASDSPRYKALGNSVAIPCVAFLMRGIAFFLEKQKIEQEEETCISTQTI